MIIHNVIQGSPEWRALRRDYFTASEAAAMMGVSPYMTRDELLKMKALGGEKEVSEFQQKLFDNGHEVEAAIRPVIAERMGQELYPMTGSETIEGLPLLASFDGLFMDESDGFEAKLWNVELADVVSRSNVPDDKIWQLEHQMAVAGISSILFVVTDGVKDVSCRYEASQERRKQLLAGWKQFKQDLGNYVHVATLDKPVAAPVTDLPMVTVSVKGSIDIVDNFAIFEKALRDFIDNRLIRKPQTDQDFADLDAQIKTLKKAEAALDGAEAQMIAQVATVDAIKRTKDMLHKLTRDNRLVAEKLLAAEKENRRNEIMQGGKTALAAHIAKLNTRIGKQYVQLPAHDFAKAMAGKKTITSLQSAVNDELARAKIASSEQADKIEINLSTLRDLAKDHMFLFADTPVIVLKENDDLTALVKMRIAEHEAKEAAKLEAQREKIRQEERAKAETEERAKRDQLLADERKKELADHVASLAKEPPPMLAGKVTNAPVAQPQEAPVVAPSMGSLSFQPTYGDIVTVLAGHYKVDRTTVIKWLMALNISNAPEETK